jgi:hypothetical protein
MPPKAAQLSLKDLFTSLPFLVSGKVPNKGKSQGMMLGSSIIDIAG